MIELIVFQIVIDLTIHVLRKSSPVILQIASRNTLVILSINEKVVTSILVTDVGDQISRTGYMLATSFGYWLQLTSHVTNIKS